MSFASDVKKELTRHVPDSRHCIMAELAAFILFTGGLASKDGHTILILHAENESIQKIYKDLLHKLGITPDADGNLQDEKALQLLQILKMAKTDKEGNTTLAMTKVDGLLIQQNCCKRNFLRGAYLASGSVSDPKKAYHFEIVCQSQELALQLQHMMSSLELDAKIVERKGHFVVYLKEGSQIITVLGLMEAPVAYMEYENARIMKEMRNDINRQVNCETANIAKTVNAAYRQVEDIRKIDRVIGLSALPENLREIAVLRLEHQDVSLKDLGEMLNPPVGKSGVNHRLRRISEIAEKLSERRGTGEYRDQV